MNMPIFTMRETRRTDRSISSFVSLRFSTTGWPFCTTRNWSSRVWFFWAAATLPSNAAMSAAGSLPDSR